MVSKMKEALCELLKSLGYNYTDNANYETKLPWLKIRTNGHRRYNTHDCRYDTINITVDIFSAYTGEKEILEIEENIGNHMNDLQISHPEIMFINQLSTHILDDKSKGPVRKHGVITYQFVVASTSIPEEEEEDNE